MKAWICNTLSNFFGPMQGAARLYAYVKKAGHDVSLKDFNQEAYFTILSRPYLEDAFEKLKHMLDPAMRTSFLRKDLGAILSNSSNGAMRQLLTRGFIGAGDSCGPVRRFKPLEKATAGILSSRINDENIYYALLGNKDYVIGEIDRARDALYKDFFNLDADLFMKNFRILLCGKALIDAAYFPTQLDFGFGLHGAAYQPSASDICRAVSDERFNFLIPYFSKDVMPMVDSERPEVVGISITHTSELVPTFTLAALIKSKYPDIHICLGGAVLTEIAYRIEKNPSLWGFFDSMVLGPGECAFGGLLERVEKGDSLSRVPNLIYKEDGILKRSEINIEFDLNDACTPEFVSLRPGQFLPLEASSGCYWGRCIFCYYPKMGLSDIAAVNCDSKRVRRIGLVLEDMEKLHKMYKPLYIGLTDSAMQPERLRQICGHNIDKGGKRKFSAFVRFEREFKSKKFCRLLAEGGLLGGQVGLESGSQRVNDTINKGVIVNDAEIILNNFYHAGMLTHLYCMVGAPGEAVKDAEMTYKFIKKMHKFITLDWQIFSLYVLERGPLTRRAGEFGLTVRPLPDEFLAQAAEYDVKKGITQEESVALSIKYYEKLKCYMNPLNREMDVESFKVFAIIQKAKER